MRQLLQWCYGSLLLLAGTLLPMQHANAILTADCSASMSPSIINVSTAITPSNADSANINATLNYTCKNTDLLLSMKVSVCLSADGGDYNPSIISPRFLKNTLNNSRLAFNMTLPGDTVWGTASGSVYKSVVHTIAPKNSVSVDVPIKISLIPNNDNKLATLGTYINNFNTSGTAITYADRLLPILSTPDCLTDVIKEKKPLLFTVQAKVVPSCVINATSDINLGSHSANQTNIVGSNNNAINTTCTNNASYYIGLSPSNGNINGAGMMSGTGSNTDKVPYQLRSTAGSAGTIWGNTATSTTVGNGLASTGTGVAQSQTVYVTVPSADVTPDNYSDTVTIRVNY